MPSSSAKRIAAMAVFRYGVDRARVRREVEAIQTARGDGPDLLLALVDKGLLTAVQASELGDLLHHPRQVQTQEPDTRCDLEITQPAAATVSTPSSAGLPRTIGGVRILRRLGEGGMGAVYLGYHEAAHQPVALKVLADELAANPVCVECFHRESKSSLLLDHPSIVRGLTSGRDEPTGTHYLVREYVDGPSGHLLLDRLGRLAVADAVRIVLDVAGALEYLHARNLVHRDIKPDNILLSRTGAAKLTDLGLLKRIGEMPAGPLVHQGFGTSYYMPPEQAVAPRTVDGRSDLYALGATFYHFLTGQVPFPGDTHPEIIQKKELGSFPSAGTLNLTVPPEVDRILTRMLARRPCDRYQTATELLADLHRCGLAAPLPSFADLDWERSGVARRYANQPTEPAFPEVKPRELNGRDAVWYLRYRDATGRWCKTKATTKQLLRRLQSGRMPATATARQEPRGRFRPLTEYALFRGNVSVAPAARPVDASSASPEVSAVPASSPVASPRGRPWKRSLKAGLAVGSLAVLGTALYVLIRSS